MPSNVTFLIIAAVTLGSAVCAMSLRNLVHCGLCLAITFAGLAATYLHLNAEFVGFAQILVYVGAVAILIVFTILLTRNAEVNLSPVSRSWIVGLVVAFIVCASLMVPLLQSPSLRRAPAMTPDATVQRIGEKLMTQYVIPLEAIALVLTAALLGAVVIAMRDEPETKVGREPISRSAASSSPSLLHGERAGVRGGNVVAHSQIESRQPDHPSPLTPLPVEGRGEPDARSVSSAVIPNTNPAP